MPNKLLGKTAVVTGAGRGIGRSIALALAGAGADVCIAARTTRDLEAVAREIATMGRRAVVAACDMSRESDIRTLAATALREFHSVDILVNNAGIGHFAPVRELPTEQFDAMWSVNMRGVFLLTRELLPGMLERRTGDIVNIASLAGRNAFIGGAGYAATKWALIGFSRCLLLEVRDRNVRVVTICPGSVETSFGNHAAREMMSKGTIPTGDDIAQIVLQTIMMPRHVMVSEVDVRPTNPKG